MQRCKNRKEQKRTEKNGKEAKRTEKNRKELKRTEKNRKERKRMEKNEKYGKALTKMSENSLKVVVHQTFRKNFLIHAESCKALKQLYSGREFAKRRFLQQKRKQKIIIQASLIITYKKTFILLLNNLFSGFSS